MLGTSWLLRRDEEKRERSEVSDIFRSPQEKDQQHSGVRN